MVTETKTEWITKHVAAVRKLAAQSGETETAVFTRVRYMIANHGRNMFNTSEDMSPVVEHALADYLTTRS